MDQYLAPLQYVHAHWVLFWRKLAASDLWLSSSGAKHPLYLHAVQNVLPSFWNESLFREKGRIFIIMLQEVEGEADLPGEARVLLERIRKHASRYCQGQKLVLGCMSEECEREVEAEQEIVQENEAFQVAHPPTLCTEFIAQASQILPELE